MKNRASARFINTWRYKEIFMRETTTIAIQPGINDALDALVKISLSVAVYPVPFYANAGPYNPPARNNAVFRSSAFKKRPSPLRFYFDDARLNRTVPRLLTCFLENENLLSPPPRPSDNSLVGPSLRGREDRFMGCACTGGVAGY